MTIIFYKRCQMSHTEVRETTQNRHHVLLIPIIHPIYLPRIIIAHKKRPIIIRNNVHRPSQYISLLQPACGKIIYFKVIHVNGHDLVTSRFLSGSINREKPRTDHPDILQGTYHQNRTLIQEGRNGLKSCKITMN